MKREAPQLKEIPLPPPFAAIENDLQVLRRKKKDLQTKQETQLISEKQVCHDLESRLLGLIPVSPETAPLLSILKMVVSKSVAQGNPGKVTTLLGRLLRQSFDEEELSFSSQASWQKLSQVDPSEITHDEYEKAFTLLDSFWKGHAQIRVVKSDPYLSFTFTKLN